MAEKGIADLVEDWQTGALFVIGSVVAGVVLGIAAGSLSGSGYLGVAGFFLGGVLAFLLLSYLSYGRTDVQ